METSLYQQQIDLYYRKLRYTDTRFKRYLSSKINWKPRLIGIEGARGVGKTTLMLQTIKEQCSNPDEALYLSLDDLWFKSNSLMDLVDYAYARGMSRLFLDEVHRFPDWAQTLKTLYDGYPDLKIVYTSSSLLNVDHSVGDLSRRQTLYRLDGMSFREYLALEGIQYMEPTALPDLLNDHIGIAMEITSRFKILPLFERYCQQGYYPFYRDADEDYLQRLQEVVRTVIDVDIPSVEEISYPTLQKAKTLLMVIAERVPLTPNVSDLFRSIETSRDLGLKLLNLLDKAGILALFSNKPKNYKNLTLPGKIFLNNTNLMWALSPQVDVGCLRETFFLNQLSNSHKVSMPEKGDFRVDNRWLFEVGGKNKKFNQIADIKDSYLAVDDIEIGYGNRIPLWMFGLLY
ncbi:MAG: AAA family ATPase [Bacteroidales bacterium]|nr:AAA family ATPase [Bacteroidales bacterium]